ncbi:M42 family metallopeptidase [Sedimentibacter sp. zth1]|uniref:M42 family metallopeptidase n=1 Tax=Sedimentibacter sp. zth1 TaxID=2816908 RepID=UPI001A934696|nr:M42 family metallopeptidase [Sedimentibacter sp. zth1]QSX06781.1 M42 family metallopeptidase [Sedimentibacter sp. zth1]
MQFNSKLMNELSDCFSPSGREKNVREYITEQVKGLVDEITVDALGNLVCHKKGTGKKVMFSAHMDQIGLLITDIDDKGFLRFCAVGGVSPYKMLDQRVVFDNKTQGIVCVEKVDDYGKLKISNLYIDIMATSKEEAEKVVSIGDMCVSKTSYYENDGYVMCNALDDRIGCYVLIEALKQNFKTDNDLYFSFSVQEEVGCRGAKTSSFAVEPDLFVALDVTATGDTLNGIKMAVKLDGGAAIKLRDNSLLVPVEVKELMTQVAEKNDIKYQYEVLEFGGTDAGAAHINKSGIRSGCISIPSRNIHSGHEIVSKFDVNECIKLAVAIANK